LQTCGIDFPPAVSTSICRNFATTCSALNFLFAMGQLLLPDEHYNTQPGTEKAGQLTVTLSR
jgi:hypothetical protein